MTNPTAEQSWDDLVAPPPDRPRPGGPTVGGAVAARAAGRPAVVGLTDAELASLRLPDDLNAAVPDATPPERGKIERGIPESRRIPESGGADLRRDPWTDRPAVAGRIAGGRTTRGESVRGESIHGDTAPDRAGPRYGPDSGAAGGRGIGPVLGPSPAGSSGNLAHLADGSARRLREVYRPEEVAGMIRRERARADRVGGRFSFVVFEPTDARPSPAGAAGDGRSRSVASRRSRWTRRQRVARLARIVLRCVRASDEVGRTADGGVCAVLPDTGPEGAWTFARRVTGSAGGHGAPATCTVFTYPTPDGARVPDGETAPAGATAAPPTDDRDGPSSGTPATPPTLTPPALPMELLLVRRSPWWKRSADVAAALAALVLAAPLLVLAAAWVRLGSPGPIIFKQPRTGRGGRVFTIYKFRTMYVDAEQRKAALRAASEQDGPAFKMRDDPRIVPGGRLLRATSVDELPQLFNILRGEMSLVGPRPLPVDEQAGCAPWHRQRLDVTPGLTCIWQVKGRSRVSFDDWMRMDLAYLSKRTAASDLGLLLQTIPAVLLRRGAA